MCLGLPYEVTEVLAEDRCMIRVGDELRHCFSGAVEDVQPGDWLVVHAGFATQKLSEEDARENLDLIERYIFGE